MTVIIGTEWALGIEARSRALLSHGDAAESLYCEAIEHLTRTAASVELARAHLLYGEWLNHEGRGADARDQLHSAYAMFAATGVEAFAARAARELASSGEAVGKHAVQRHDDLTPQEAQIARLASEGLSNAEIGARMFISSRTVQYHLRKVFTKLGISSRTQLERALPGDASRAPQN
jgi:DNA-binding CsgD family transcriptional regulator